MWSPESQGRRPVPHWMTAEHSWDRWFMPFKWPLWNLLILKLCLCHTGQKSLLFGPCTILHVPVIAASVTTISNSRLAMLTIVLSELEVIQFSSYFQLRHTLTLLPLGVFQIIDQEESQSAFIVTYKNAHCGSFIF